MMKKMILFCLCISIVSVGHSQRKVHNEIHYKYQDSILFSTSKEYVYKEGPYAKQDTLIYKVDTVKPKETLTVDLRNKKHLIYLGSNSSLHFLQLTPQFKVIKSVDYILIDSSKKYYPKRIILHDFKNDMTKEVICEAFDEWPIFRIFIFEWNLKNGSYSIKEVFRSDYFFSYPSWEPLKQRKKPKMQGNSFIIPYCKGCHTGEKGVLRKRVLIYSPEEDKYKFKK